MALGGSLVAVHGVPGLGKSSVAPALLSDGKAREWAGGDDSLAPAAPSWGAVVLAIPPFAFSGELLTSEVGVPGVAGSPLHLKALLRYGGFFAVEPFVLVGGGCWRSSLTKPLNSAHFMNWPGTSSRISEANKSALPWHSLNATNCTKSRAHCWPPLLTSRTSSPSSTSISRKLPPPTPTMMMLTGSRSRAHTRSMVFWKSATAPLVRMRRIV
mmetsp:Transcript_18151/g.32282  ORF Transcript_18151/g.32282 Transcript_18151/m.32282 type:complete len:213 (+) Transcript_18151:1282-1920(+)